MTFHSIVRQWCKAYKYMRDNEERGNRRFHLTDSQQGVIELAKGEAVAMKSPCIVMESGVEGGGAIRRPIRNYPIYFFVKAEKMSDGDAAALAKEEAWAHAKNFLSWLLYKREQEMENGNDGDFARISLDDAFVDFQTIGPLQDGWYALMLQLDREEPLDLCINPDLYIEEEC